MPIRQLLVLGAGLGPLGVVLSVLGWERASAITTLGGLAVGLLALHRFGRSGPDLGADATVIAATAPPAERP